MPPSRPQVALKELRVAASALRIHILGVEVQGPQGFEEAFASITREHATPSLSFRIP
jgi:hypothetical protein